MSKGRGGRGKWNEKQKRNELVLLTVQKGREGGYFTLFL